MGIIIFFLPQNWWDRIAPVLLLLPLLLWVSARCGPTFTSAAVFIVSLTIIGAFIFGLGHFGDVVPSTEQPIFAVQSAVLGVAIFSYILAALFAERRLAEEHQKTLTRELQHRTNNLLAVVQTIANRTLSGDYPLKQANEILEARLRALARANKQLTDSDWSGLTLKEIIRSEMEPYLTRFEIEGTDIALNRQYAQNFSLVLHELATNAVKYGALSNLEGRVHITWSMQGGGGDSRLIFHWREQGGPPAVTPKRQGFGSALLRATFANARSNFDINGFSCEIEVPFREVAPVGAQA
jgi:two-component sensor histidine kinase